MLSALLTVVLISSLSISATIIPRETPSEGWMSDYFEVSVPEPRTYLSQLTNITVLCNLLHSLSLSFM